METFGIYAALLAVAIYFLFSWVPFWYADKAVKTKPEVGKKPMWIYSLILGIISFGIILWPMAGGFPEEASFQSFYGWIFENFIILSLMALGISSITHFHLHLSCTNKEEMYKYKGAHTSSSFPDDMSAVMFVLGSAIFFASLVNKFGPPILKYFEQIAQKLFG